MQVPNWHLQHSHVCVPRWLVGAVAGIAVALAALRPSTNTPAALRTEAPVRQLEGNGGEGPWDTDAPQIWMPHMEVGPTAVHIPKLAPGGGLGGNQRRQNCCQYLNALCAICPQRGSKETP